MYKYFKKPFFPLYIRVAIPLSDIQQANKDVKHTLSQTLMFTKISPLYGEKVYAVGWSAFMCTE